MNQLKRLMASVLIVSTTLMGVPLTAQASMVSTTEAMATQAGDANHDKVTAFLAREDVRTELQAQGVSSASAIDRVKAMSDAEVSQLASRVDQAPAGGILGLIFTVFIVLLVTDILGLTKVFPFTRSVR
ncbi:PA2779 family protein [Polaromonas sp. P1-6]|nr:PA2779 family protein [Polaromonas sp. P1-6]